MNPSRLRLLRTLSIGFTLTSMVGCFTPRTTEAMREQTMADVQQGNFAAAKATVNSLYGSHAVGEQDEPGASPAKSASYDDKQALIWHMERGMIGHLQGDLGSSDIHLNAAATLVDERRTKTLVTEVGTAFANDTLRDYAGKPFEHIQVDYYRALNRILEGQKAEGLYDPTITYATFNGIYRQAAPESPEATPGQGSKVPTLVPDVAYEQAINFTRRMTTNQLKETLDAAGSNRYQDDPFARLIAGALTFCQAPKNRSDSNAQYANVMFKTALSAYAAEAKIYGDGHQPFRYEVRHTPQFLTTLFIRQSRSYDPTYLDEHYAEFGLQAGDPRLKQSLLPRDFGSVLVLNHVGYISHPQVLDIRAIAAGIKENSASENQRGVTVSTFNIGSVVFYAKGPGSDIVNAWGAVVLPADVVQNLLAPGGAAFMGFALPVHEHDHPILPPGQVHVHGEQTGASDITAQMEVVSDLDAYARATLKDEQPGLLTKTIIRAVAKQVAAGIAAHEAEKRNALLGLAVGLIGSTAATLTEVADTRAWTTLPDHIEACLIDLPTGSYSLAVDTHYGTVNLGQVTVPPGRIVVVPVRTFPEPVHLNP